MKNAYTRERFPIIYPTGHQVWNPWNVVTHPHHKRQHKIIPIHYEQPSNSFMPPQPTGYMKCRKHEHY